MRLDVVTIFPEYLEPLNVSLVGKARARGQLDVRVHDLRAWTHDRHHTVDDTPYGGGPGMVMKPEPWGEALDAVAASGAPGERPVLVVPTPSGRPFTQALAVELSGKPWLVFAPARYEGIDRRVIDDYAGRWEVYEVSISLWNTSYVVAPGHALEFYIQSSNEPRFHVNKNNGVLLVDDRAGVGSPVIAENVIHHSARYPSSIILPEVNKHQLPKVNIIKAVEEALPDVDIQALSAKVQKYTDQVIAAAKHY